MIIRSSERIAIMKKRGLKITLGILIGCLAVGATWGCLYGFNSSVRNWVDNAVNKVTKNVPDEYKNVTVESTLELTANEIKLQGLQNSEKVEPVFNLKFALKNMPKDFKGDDTLVTKVITGNQDSVYFTMNGNKSYNSITHDNGSSFAFFHKAFGKSGQSERYLIKTYWAAYPDIFVNSELIFKSDYKAQVGDPMQIVDTANLTESLKAINGVQIYADEYPYALIAPTLKNKSDKISSNPLIGHKVIYGNAELVGFGNTLDDDIENPIGFTRSGEMLVIGHEIFEETDRLENYVIRSYLVEDESVYLDSRITFKSDFGENDLKDDSSYTVEFTVTDEGNTLSRWNADQDKSCEVNMSFDSSVNKVTYLRIVAPEGMHTPVIKIGAKTYRNGVVEVQDDDDIQILLDDVKNNKDYTYYMDYICLEDPQIVERQAVTVHGYVASEHVSPGGGSSSSNPDSSSSGN